MIYPSVQSAVVSALAAECIDSTSKQAWQKLIDLDTVRVGSGVSGSDRMQADCWVFARLHSQLIPRHWNALVAKFSTHKGRKVQAISALVPVVASPSSQLFKSKAVAAWAVPKLRGVDGKRSADMIVLPAAFYDMNTWDLDGRPESTRREWRRNIQKVLEEMVSEALKASEQILNAEGVLRCDHA